MTTKGANMRGGARQGAGRPCMGKEKKTTIALRIQPETKERILEMAARKNTSPSALLEAVLEAKFPAKRQSADKDN